MKANKIIEMSQEKSRQKVKLAMDEIQRMRNEGERITVSGLCKRTGLSNEGYFYGLRLPVSRIIVNRKLKIRNKDTGVAQLVEHWSPKPGVGSSSLSSRAEMF